MTLTRIRYRKLDNLRLESTQTFVHPTNGAQYIVRIDPTDKWLVLDAHTEIVALSGHYTDKLSAQLAAKEGLRALGVVLPSEGKRAPRTKKNV